MKHGADTRVLTISGPHLTTQNKELSVEKHVE